MTLSPPTPVVLVSARMPLTGTPHLLTRTPHPPGGLVVTLALLRAHWQLLALMLAVALATAVLVTVNRQTRRPCLPVPLPPMPPAPLPSMPTRKRPAAPPPVRETAARRAAETLVATMPTPLWPMALARAVRLLARGDAAREAEVRRRLRLSRTLLTGAAPTEAETVRRAAVDQWSLAFTTLRGRDAHTPALLNAFSDTFTHLLATAVPPRNRGTR
ncbi:hypothetical protein [Streptosporangium saharense]|uniref:hypothetical protein n=1 Tax=Streptosporangium saharense TaxID=1706840 RepID=UPI00342F42A1